MGDRDYLNDEVYYTKKGIYFFDEYLEDDEEPKEEEYWEGFRDEEPEPKPERLETKLLNGYKIVLGWKIDREAERSYICDVGLLLDECGRGSYQLPTWAGLIFPAPGKVSFEEMEEIWDGLIAEGRKKELLESAHSFYRGLDDDGMLARLKDGMGLWLASHRYLEQMGKPMNIDAREVWQRFCLPRYPYWYALWYKERNYCPAETARQLSAAEKSAFAQWLKLPSFD